jgi:hypothetical protein
MGGNRVRDAELWHAYTVGKQTYFQLAERHGISVRTVQRRLDRVRPLIPEPQPREVVVLMDTTYFGRTFGVMLFKDAYTGENLFKQYVKYETNRLYLIGIEVLRAKGFTIRAIVCDGRRGLMQSFGSTPVQMCQFHQSAIIRRYLTKRPKLQAAQELLRVLELMTVTDRESFTGALQDWHRKWEAFLNERSTSPLTSKTFYTHKRLRSAYRSICNNLPWLFTWYDHHELGIPNTTNAIDGHFADLKNKLRNHNGLSLQRKMRFIDEFLKA